MIALGGMAIGAGAALLFAPRTGRATRAMLRDRMTRYSNDVSDFVDGKARHLRNKAKGYRHVTEDMMDAGQEMAMASGLANG
jgi:gas vesicle protein